MYDIFEEMFYDLGAEGGTFLIVWLLLMLSMVMILLAWLVVAYILQSKAMYAIAQRRRIPNPWMAWVPFCNSWMLGAISDDYQIKVWGTVNNRRRNLLIWHICYTVALNLYMSSYFTYMFSMESGDPEVIIGFLGLFLLVCLAMIAVSVIYMVIYYKALFDLFRSSNPNRSMMYLLLSIFTQYPTPFFIYGCRNKDDGMPIPPERLPENT
jgi:hypothetical protein